MKGFELTTTHLMIGAAVVVLGFAAPKISKNMQIGDAIDSKRFDRKLTEKDITEESRLAMTLAEKSQRASLPGSKEGGIEAPLQVGMQPVDPQTQLPFSAGTVVSSKHGTVGTIGADGKIDKVYKVSSVDREPFLKTLNEIEGFRTSAGVNGKPSPLPTITPGQPIVDQNGIIINPPTGNEPTGFTPVNPQQNGG